MLSRRTDISGPTLGISGPTFPGTSGLTFPGDETTPGVCHAYQVRMGRLDKAGAPGAG
jgi:hypothetical protein